MNNPLDYLLEQGLHLEEIEDLKQRNDFTYVEMAEAVESIATRGGNIREGLGLSAALSDNEAIHKALPGIKDAKNVRELLTEDVRDLYRAEQSREARALIAADLREIAKRGKFTKEFDSVFQEFQTTVEKDEANEVKSASGGRVSIETVSMALKELGISVRYNQLLKEVDVQGLPTCYSSENAVNVLPAYLMDYLRESDFSGVTRQAIDDCLSCIADQNRYNPVREYLESGVWDKADRFTEVCRILGVTSRRHQTYILKWFIQCVALGLNDGEKPIGADGVLVLQGEQGLAKTSFFRIMAPFPRWFVEGAIIDMGNKDTIITALSGWICELGELDSTLKKEQMSLKAFVTRPEDRIRTPYARTDTRAPRRTSFCGTVNPKNYLKDETGNRRFWTVPVTNVDKKALFALPREWVNQVWFEAYAMYQADPSLYRLSDEEIKELQAENREFEAPLPYELEIQEMLDYSLPVSQWEWWKAGEVAKLMPGNADANKVGRVLARVVKNTQSPPTKSAKLVHGITEYLIPMKHFRPSWVEEVTQRWHESR